MISANFILLDLYEQCNKKYFSLVDKKQCLFFNGSFYGDEFSFLFSTLSFIFKIFKDQKLQLLYYLYACQNSDYIMIRCLDQIPTINLNFLKFLLKGKQR